MRKSLVLMLVILAFVFGTMVTAFATTIPSTILLDDSKVKVDLLPLFDTNGDEKISFGDGFLGGVLNPDSHDFDHYNQSEIERTFVLDSAYEPISDVDFAVSFKASGVNYSINYILLNGVESEIHNGSNSFEGSNSSLLFGSDSMNSITFKIGEWAYKNLDDFYIHSLTLEYQYDSSSSGSNPVPEPSTMVLLGIGLLGAARLGRMKK